MQLLLTILLSSWQSSPLINMSGCKQAFAEMNEQGVMIDASTCMTLLCVMHRARQWRLAEAAFLAAFGRAEPFAALQLPPLQTHDLSPTVAAIVARLQKLSSTGEGMQLLRCCSCELLQLYWSSTKLDFTRTCCLTAA
jgi:hypothetical protein